ncbi:MAG: TonB-dependent receptor [Bryobacteraceae bacterium]
MTTLFIRGFCPRIAAALVLILCSASLAFAQLPTGSILGVVRDPAGAVVPNVMLTATNTETGAARSAASGADGAYRFSALPVGTYDVRAAIMGFQTAVRTGLKLEVDGDAVVNFNLQVGELTQTVEVAADAQLVNTTSSALGAVVNEAAVAELPLNGRNYIDLTFLQAGVSRNENTTSGGTFVGSWYSSNGAPLRSNSYMIDGAVMGNVLGGTASSIANTTLGIEGIREWKVITNTFSAEYGLTMGSQMAMVTKSGGNAFHGSLFEYLRNSALDARNFFDYTTAATPGRLPPFKRNNYGGSIGGPVMKDKLFFFGTYEALRERYGVTSISNTIPSGCTTEPLPAGCRPDNGTTIDPRTKAFALLFPTPNLPGNRYTFPFNRPTDEHYGQGRVDWNISQSDTLFGRYTDDRTTQLAPLSFPGFVTDRFSTNRYTTISETHIFSPTLLNTFRFSFSDTVLNLTSPTSITGTQYELVPGKGMGVINIAGVGEFGPRFSAPIRQNQQVFSYSDDVYFTKGSHSMKFGMLINQMKPEYTLGAASVGTIAFASTATFLQGVPTRFTARAPGSILDSNYKFGTMGFYAQDDWKLNSRLTLNLGIRYETLTDPTETNGHVSAIRNLLVDANPVCADTTFCLKADDPGKMFNNPSRKNFSPRVGFAWDVFGNGKTAIRGGAAILYDVATFGSAILGLGWPYSATTTVSGGAAANFTLPLVLPTGPGSRSAGGVDFNVQQPYSFQSNFSVEQALFWDMALSVTYANTRGINLYRRTEGNPRVPLGTPTVVNGANFCASQGATTFNPTGVHCWLGTENRLNTNWADASRLVADSNSYYHGLQIGLRKRFNHGLQFQSNYTFSKAIDETQGIVDAENTASHFAASDPFNRRTDRGPSSFDLNHNWSLNALYALPKFSVNGAMSNLVNGWRLGGIIRVRTGFPFTPVLGANRSRSAALGGPAGLDRPDYLPGVDASALTSGVSVGCARSGSNIAAGTPVGTPNLWFDPCAFGLPSAGFLGNAGRNSMRGPGLSNVDFSISKDTPLKFLGEQGRLEFRMETFNLFNHANFATPEVGVADSYAAAVVFPGNDSTARSATVGEILKTATQSRQIQFALKILF